MLNIKHCVICGSMDVFNEDLDIPVNIRGIMSVKLKGVKCIKCSEEYYDLADLKLIEDFEAQLKKFK